MTVRKWEGPDWRIECGDCLDMLKSLPSGSVDAVVTDPPYGIGEHGGACRTRGRPGYAKHENRGWDNHRPTAEVFRQILGLGVPTMIWGGNYFADLLPASSGWCYWRKLMGGDFSDGELAWTNLSRSLREFTKCLKGIDKEHPCQKPEDLMRWCFEYMDIRDNATILDPFMGSGTTGVACIQTGRKFIGFELDAKYCEIAARRIGEVGELFRQPKGEAQ